MADTATGAPGAEQHWDGIYRTREPDSVSWYQAVPTTALDWIGGLGLDLRAPVVDVGSGASTFVDGLLDRGHRDVTALDISTTALQAARARLGDRAGQVRWVVGDLLDWRPPRRFALWHDRAVFHFLVDPSARKRYVDLAVRATAPGATVVLATFAADAAPTCSGLEVARYGLEELSLVMPASFEVVFAEREEHRTPGGAVQPFSWVAWHRHHG